MADLPLTGNAQFTIPIDDDDDDNQSQATIPIASDNDNDSTYGADSQSQTTSLTSSIWEYHYENGRRYNASRKGTYWYHYHLSACSPVPRTQFKTHLASHMN
jgi:hypothetical protein